MAMKVRWVALAAGLFSGILLLPLSGQECSFSDRVEQAFGLDQELINGIQVYNRYLKVKGHPYFGDDRFLEGTVSIHGRVFQGLLLKYDIHAQCLELEYRNFSGGINRLILVSDHVDGFRIGEYVFQKLDFEAGPQFCQVIQTAHFSCIIRWSKKLITLKYDTEFTGQFTSGFSSFMLMREDEVITFRNRNTFSACFPDPMQKRIRQLLAGENISFRKASPEAITRAMHAVSAMLDTGGSP